MKNVCLQFQFACTDLFNITVPKYQAFPGHETKMDTKQKYLSFKIFCAVVNPVVMGNLAPLIVLQHPHSKYPRETRPMGVGM